MDARMLAHNLGGHWKNGRGQAPCPICQPERRHDQSALSITEQGGKLLLYCFKSQCRFVDVAEAANLPVGGAQIDSEARKQTERKQTDYQANKLAKARSLWNVAKPITGTKAEAYLRGRSISCDFPASLRFMPDIHHPPSMTWGCAMVGNVSTGGVHRTYFDKSGVRLAKDHKLMLGPCSGGAVRLSDGAGPLVVCEGIETGLSLVQLLVGHDPEVWAALSTSGMKALALPSGSRELIVASDGDEPGRQAAISLATRASALGWVVSTMDPGDGKDFNDVLIAGVM